MSLLENEMDSQTSVLVEKLVFIRPSFFWWSIRWQLICSSSLVIGLQTFRPQSRRHRQCAVE
ncbi:hypothetical protein CSKR_108520 [Clonorchis sinensis]|uniref:Uncharacterized protein n=1 Tax=Clonorchis sinensis TaxID=79923 RepID=A0A419QHJ6_CLOSI|nr:hypothetical protein CSKR_108520 [Clonorchis sinensis]